ncbi:Glucosamine-6-phosphate deaminase [Paramixta manurensis]|uniref:Glucosamine-6-phosphate deaminase n=2 Tax=Paramixta manurensis TaxID=2740817 RepID=A0A6M8U3C5_9GAMM|nr:Glucosamine-6-phosphate deaminase [Erwiniaceae bacterium PD-1]
MESQYQNRQYEKLQVKVFPDRQALGYQAAEEAAAYLRQRLASQQQVRIVFAAAPSQNAFLDRLRQAPDIEWSRVSAFHMDEYIGLAEGAEQLFSHYLTTHLFRDVQPGEVHLIPASGQPEQIIQRYSDLLAVAPIDMVCLGIGENGHLAFNDPPVADFADPQVMKVVELDAVCRQQQVNDGCFSTLAAVPRHALTLTIPTLLSAQRLFCMVPGKNKRQAVTDTLRQPITTACPSTILRQHAGCTLYTDSDAFQELADA